MPPPVYRSADRTLREPTRFDSGRRQCSASGAWPHGRNDGPTQQVRAIDRPGARRRWLAHQQGASHPMVDPRRPRGARERTKTRLGRGRCAPPSRSHGDLGKVESPPIPCPDASGDDRCGPSACRPRASPPDRHARRGPVVRAVMRWGIHLGPSTPGERWWTSPGLGRNPSSPRAP